MLSAKMIISLRKSIINNFPQSMPYYNGCQLTTLREIITKLLSALRHAIEQLLTPKFGFLNLSVLPNHRKTSKSGCLKSRNVTQ
jgi:hypothetical protein